MMQIPLGKKMTNFKCKPPENRLNLPGRGSVKQSSKMQAYRAYGAAHFYVQNGAATSGVDSQNQSRGKDIPLPSKEGGMTYDLPK